MSGVQSLVDGSLCAADPLWRYKLPQIDGYILGHQHAHLQALTSQLNGMNGIGYYTPDSEPYAAPLTSNFRGVDFLGQKGADLYADHTPADVVTAASHLSQHTENEGPGLDNKQKLKAITNARRARSSRLVESRPLTLQKGVRNGEKGPCKYFLRGHCWNGGNCEYSHEDADSLKILGVSKGGLTPSIPSNRDPGVGALVLGGMTSLDALELEMLELLCGQQAVSIAALPQLYSQQFGKDLEADGYMTGSQRQGRPGNTLAKLLARMSSISVWTRPDGQLVVGLKEQQNGGSGRLLGETLNRSSPSNCQIYLTFPANSTFTEDDVKNYFSLYGMVEDVRIPMKEKRNFGFVTFTSPEPVKALLSSEMEHKIKDSVVLVKPYCEKGKLGAKSKHSERADTANRRQQRSTMSSDQEYSAALNRFARSTSMLSRRRTEEELDLSARSYPSSQSQAMMRQGGLLPSGMDSQTSLLIMQQQQLQQAQQRLLQHEQQEQMLQQQLKQLQLQLRFQQQHPTRQNGSAPGSLSYSESLSSSEDSKSFSVNSGFERLLQGLSSSYLSRSTSASSAEPSALEGLSHSQSADSLLPYLNFLDSPLDSPLHPQEDHSVPRTLSMGRLNNLSNSPPTDFSNSRLGGVADEKLTGLTGSVLAESASSKGSGYLSRGSAGLVEQPSQPKGLNTHGDMSGLSIDLTHKHKPTNWSTMSGLGPHSGQTIYSSQLSASMAPLTLSTPTSTTPVSVVPDPDRTCMSCRDIFVEMVQLECMHSFCLPCLSKELAGSNSKCLVCQSPVRIRNVDMKAKTWDAPPEALTRSSPQRW